MARGPIRPHIGPVHKGVFNLFKRVQGGTYEPRVPQAYTYPSVGQVYDIERDGVAVIGRALNKLVAHMETEAEFVAYEALRPTFELSQEYTPLDTGDLRSSGELEMRVRGRRKEHVCEISYGKSGIPFYTVFVHENLDVAHLPPTSAKFLSRALAEDMGNIERRIVRLGLLMFGTGYRVA